MAGAAQRLQQQAQANNMNMAVQVIDSLDKALDAYKLRVLNDLKEIKAHPERLADLVVSDGDYELKPAQPQIVRNGKEKVGV